MLGSPQPHTVITCCRTSKCLHSTSLASNCCMWLEIAGQHTQAQDTAERPPHPQHTTIPVLLAPESPSPCSHLAPPCPAPCSRGGTLWSGRGPAHAPPSLPALSRPGAPLCPPATRRQCSSSTRQGCTTWPASPRTMLLDLVAGQWPTISTADSSSRTSPTE